MRKLFVFLMLFVSTAQAGRFILLLHPVGYPGGRGRRLLEGNEQGAVLRFAQALKKALEKEYPSILVVVSRKAGEELSVLQVSSFSNRLCANFFVSVTMYKQKDEMPKVSLYHLLYDPLVDTAKRHYELALTPLKQAHFKNISITKAYGKKMYDVLHQDKHLDCSPLMGLPLKLLGGNTAPALHVELGVPREEKSNDLIGPIVKSLGFLQKENV